jgi:hypothetical protein
VLLVDVVGLGNRRRRHRGRVPPAAVPAGRLRRRTESGNRARVRRLEVDYRPRSLIGEWRWRRRHHVCGRLSESEVLLQLQDELLVEQLALAGLKILLLLHVERLGDFLRLQNS